MKEKTHKDIKIEALPQSKVKITGEIEAKHFDQARQAVIKKAKETAELPGFRAGKAPEAMVIEHLGEIRILERAAEDVINNAYGDILDEHNVRAIGMPSISITKIAAGNPLGFVIETAVMPEITLENYKKLAIEAKKSIPDAPQSVDEKEIDKIIEDLRKHMATPAAEGEAEPKLPEVNDEFAKKFGDFASVADL
ncbi:MAG TPA: trigger factor family protein, partial [Candidatus Nanoarchaeia archaeon]|nr:trigger factor family protein [Candidatus Nanoarchaeia archaeon]